MVKNILPKIILKVAALLRLASCPPYQRGAGGLSTEGRRYETFAVGAQHVIA